MEQDHKQWHQIIPSDITRPRDLVIELDLIIKLEHLTELESFSLNICDGYVMSTRGAYFSGHLVPPPNSGLHMF